MLRDRALLNRMGFPNLGASVIAARLRRRSGRVVVGANVGKSMDVPLERAAGDYRAGVRPLASVCDYLVVNVSSPNTPGLKQMQTVELLRPLLREVQRELREMGVEVPLLVKVGPDLADRQLLAIADLALELALDGIVAVNTSEDRTLLSDRAGPRRRRGRRGLRAAAAPGAPWRSVHLLRERIGDRLVPIYTLGPAVSHDPGCRERARSGPHVACRPTPRALVYVAARWWPSHVEHARSRNGCAPPARRLDSAARRQTATRS